MKYEEIEKDIISALQARKHVGITEEAGFDVLGVAYIELQDDLQSITIGGKKRLPVVIVVGKTTGIVYQYALKVLLPDMEL